jgi:predicted DNA binding CopG/RHH family protein
MAVPVAGFEWDDGNRRKCQVHGVSIAEIEAMFQRPGATSSSCTPIVGAMDPYSSGRSARDTCTAKRLLIMKRKLPKLKTDEEAEAFVANSDLSDFDLGGMRMVQYEFAPKEARINMRLPVDLLKAVRSKAATRGIPYQRFIRQALEQAVGGAKEPTKRRRAG